MSFDSPLFLLIALFNVLTFTRWRNQRLWDRYFLPPILHFYLIHQGSKASAIILSNMLSKFHCVINNWRTSTIFLSSTLYIFSVFTLIPCSLNLLFHIYSKCVQCYYLGGLCYTSCGDYKSHYNEIIRHILMIFMRRLNFLHVHAFTFLC